MIPLPLRPLLWLAASAAALAAIAVVAGCAIPGAGSAPAWITTPAAGAEHRGDLTAVGVGPTRSAAEEAALMRLSQRIRTNIESTERGSLIERQSTQGSTIISSAGDASISRHVRLTAARELLGAEIAQTYYSRAQGAHFALALLRPAQSAMAYEADIETRERQITSAIARSDRARSPLGAMAALRAARDAAREREDLLQTWRALTGRSAPPNTGALSADQIQERLIQVRQTLRASIEPVGDVPDEVVAPWFRALQRREIPITTQGNGSSLRLRISLKIESTSSYDPRRRIATWRATVEAIDSRTGLAMDTLSISGKAVALDPGAAYQEAVRSAAAALADRVDVFLDNVLQG